MQFRLLLISTLVSDVISHGALISPAPRNAFDRHLPQYIAGGLCNCANSSGCDVGDLRTNMNGQPCFWFSQGCFIGCAECTGTDIQPEGMNKSHEGNGCTLNNRSAGGTSQPTLPKRCWTVNRGAVEDSVNDTYRFHPWRAPGSAPVADSCGVAGGTQSRFAGPGHAIFSNVTVANVTVTLGDRGSLVLPRGKPQATWTIGSAVEVKWALRFNHGGGYQYRLCPADQPLTEDCFNLHPLDFIRDKQALEWKNGSRLSIPGVYVDEGVIPVGATWARNPIPTVMAMYPGCDGHRAANATDPVGEPCRQFDPPCPQDDGWSPVGSDDADVMGVCSGNWVDGVVVDQVVIPSSLSPGPYVLGFRWDCEQTSQVWSSCSDVELVSS